MKSTIYINDLTTIDAAVLTQDGSIMGESLNLSVKLTGNTTKSESVVLDFSTAKKRIKDLIDHKEYGFDHKLWVRQGLFNHTLDDDGDFVIKTPFLGLKVPQNAVRMLPEDMDLTSVIRHFLEFHLNEEFSVEVLLNHSFPFKNTWQGDNQYCSPFRYVHGLKDSTSWGCQNIAHGHHSYISLESKSPKDMYLVDLSDTIAKALHNAIFINRDNLYPSNAHGDCILGYTVNRGDFYMSLDSHKNNIIDLDTETTIECLADYVLRRFGSTMRRCGVTGFYISEGLVKGAYQEVQQ